MCSGKGGVGKSCVAAYTAITLAAMKKNVLLIDAGSAPGSLDTILGASDEAVFNLRDVLSGECEPRKAVIPVRRYENLFLLPAGIAPANTGAKLSFAELIRDIKNDFDYIFVDSPDFSMFEPKMATMILLVTTPDTLSVRAAAQKSRELYDSGARNIRLVINNVPARVIPMRSFKDFDDIIDTIGAQLIAIIPASQRLQYSANNGLPLSRESLTVSIFHNLAERIRGKSEPLLIR